MVSFDFSKFSQTVMVEITRDLLNVSQQRNLILFDPKYEGKYKPDLMEIDSNGEVDTIVEIKGKGSINKEVADSLLEGFKEFYNRYHPREIIIISFAQIFQEVKILLKKNFDTSLAVDFSILDIKWIEEQLSEYPEVWEEYNSIWSITDDLKHALSTEDDDPILIQKGYINQGIIGYIHSIEKENTVPLNQVFFTNVLDYFYFIYRELESFADHQISEERIIGYLSLESERFDLELKRYFREDRSAWDHFYCTGPNEKLLSRVNYIQEKENVGFDGKYLLPQSGKDIIPLYVYSNNSEINLFSSQIIQYDSTKGINNDSFETSTEKIQTIIQSKLDSDSNLWWINAADRWNIDDLEIGETESYGLKSQAGTYQRYVKGLKTDDLLIGYQAKPDKEIVGLFKITEPAGKDDRYHIELIYKFENKSSLEELKKLPLFGKSSLSKTLQGSLHKLEAKLFQEIIDTTELNPDIENATAEESTDSIPFHLDQVENTDRLNREPIAKSVARLLNIQIFASSLKRSFYFRWMIYFLRFFRIQFVAKKIPFTERISDWLNNSNEDIQAEKKSRHSFMIHLQGAWGDGKSTFLNLIESNLNTEKQKWIVVKFNAWQHQHVSPPWWSFLDQIYTQSTKSLPWYKSVVLWAHETIRRVINMKSIYNFITLSIVLVAGFFIYRYFPSILDFSKNDSQKDPSIGDSLMLVTKVLIAIGTVSGLIYTMAQFVAKPLLLKSPQSAKSFLQQVADPMMKIKKHFESLISNIEILGYRIAIFIDDLDRCNSQFAVELLEGIQTLYKDRKVLYIVAGDKNWISECFENHYSDFDQVVIEPGQKLGYLFLEKAFQLSIRLPQISGKVKDKYWEYILDPNKRILQNQTTEDKSEIVPNRTSVESEELKTKFKEKFNKQEYSSPQQIEELTKELGVSDVEATDILLEYMSEDAEDIKHKLQNHSDLIKANPRSIKRLANQYNIYRDILIAERRTFNPDKLFRWLILENVYPLYTDLVEKDSKVYTKSNLPDEIKALKDNSHWEMLVMDSKKKRGGKLEMKDVEQYIGAEKETSNT